MKKTVEILDSDGQNRIASYIKTRPINRIIEITAVHCGITTRELLSDGKTYRTVYPKMMAMALARKYAKRSFPEIGKRFNRDHSTVVSACNRVKQLRNKEKFRVRFDGIESDLIKELNL